jgi:O-succinylbenzoic acid--CoA ligase
MKVVDPLYLRVTHSPDHLFLVTPDRSWSYLETEIKIQQITSALINYGICRGSRVGILASNQPDYIFFVLALTRIGAVSVFLNRRMNIASIAKQLESTGVQLLLTDQKLELNNITVISFSNCDTKQLKTHPTLSLNEAHSVFFSSGTTGNPKPVLLTLGNHYYSAISVLSRLVNNTENRYWLLCLPLFHVGAFSIVWRCLWSGMTIFLTEGFEASQIMQIVNTYPIGLISLVPTMLVRILDDATFEQNRSVWQNLHSIMIGGAPLAQKLGKRCLFLKLPLAISYGLTEASSTVSLLTTNEWKTKPFSVGKPLPGMEIKIEEKQIKIRGRSVFLNQNTWFDTKDLGYLDKDGYLYITDRLDHMIICGGENIYPQEIEVVLLQHPKINDVCVLGIPDREWGEIPLAVIVSDYPIKLQQIKEFCIDQGLDSYKIPKKIAIIEKIPKNALGKTDRAAIKLLLANQGNL